MYASSTDVVKRTFNFELNKKELGVIVKKFESSTNKGYVDNHAFLIKFFQMGVEERQKMKVCI